MKNGDGTITLNGDCLFQLAKIAGWIEKLMRGDSTCIFFLLQEL
jgi:hypothetical protein